MSGLGDVAVFDLETTDRDPDKARIVEIGIVTRIGGTVEKHRWLVDPGVPIPAEASKVHGITAGDLVNAPRFESIADRVCEVLGGVAHVGGYNASVYDVDVLNAELRRCGRPEFAAGGVLDPLVAIRWWYRGKRFRKLGDVCAFLSVDLGRAHSALDDATATLAILDTLVERGDIPENVDEALRLQSAWAIRIDGEFERWGYWLYTDRETGEVMIGCGKHCGRRLASVPTSYLRWVLSSIPDLPHGARRAMAQALRGDL